jgi:predicted O-methyltransferase YrrM
MNKRGASAARRISRTVLRHSVGSRLGLGIVRTAMTDPHVRAELLLSLSDRMVREASFEEALKEPNFKAPMHGFDDLAWLFSSNWLNHRFTRLDLDEAVYLFRLAKSLGNPRIAELGRFRGGTTIFFAAVCGELVSVDGNPRQDVWGPQLESVLDRLEVRDRVTLVVGDTRTCETGPGPYDLVFFDASVTTDAIRAEMERWWPAIAPGGHAIFRDGRAQLPHLMQVQAEVDRFWHASGAERIPDDQVPGCLVHLVKPSFGL